MQMINDYGFWKILESYNLSQSPLHTDYAIVSCWLKLSKS